MVFKKSSAFSQSDEVTERLEAIRRQTINSGERSLEPQQKLQKSAAYDLLAAAELLLEINDDKTGALQLLREAKVELDAQSA